MTEKPNDQTAPDVSGKSQTTGYADAIKELEGFESDARANRLAQDPQEIDEEWKAFMSGIRGAISRLKMNA